MEYQALTFYSSEQEANPDSITKVPQFLKIYIKKTELQNPVGVGGVRLLGRKKGCQGKRSILLKFPFLGFDIK